ncbi:MAG: glycosyltransferase family 39 protein, partial [Bacteroidota bacterium]
AFKAAGYHYFKVTVLDQILGYSSGAEGHPNPFYYYFITFPLEALPWSIFLAPVFYSLYQRRNQLPELINFAVIWFICTFITFSVIGSKRGLYLLQLYPAFAILIAWYFEQHLKQLIKSPKGLKIPVVIFGIFLLLVGLFLAVKGDSLVAKVVDAPLADKDAYNFVISSLTWFAIIFGCFFGAALFHKDKRVIFGVTIAFSFCFVLILKGIVMPVMNPVKSERYLAEELARQRTANQSVGLWGSQNNDSGFIFYNGVYFDPVLNNSQAVKRFLKQPGGKILVVANDENFYKAFGRTFPADWLVKKYCVGSKNMLLIKVVQ